MNEKERTERIAELESEASDRYIENADWERVIECLDENDQKEYWKLVK
jgi:hypothetical protein